MNSQKKRESIEVVLTVDRAYIGSPEADGEHGGRPLADRDMLAI